MATGAAATVDELRASSLTVLTLALTAAACTGSSGDDQLDVVFDVCGPIRVVTSPTSPAQTAAIDEAIELWRAHGVPAISRGTAGDEPSIEIRFEDAARNFHGRRAADGRRLRWLHVNLVANDSVDEFTKSLAQSYQARTKLVPEVYVCRASRGAGLV